MGKIIWKVSDLSGCSVFTINGERLGYIYDVLPTRGNDIWAVRSEDRKGWEMMIPALKDVIVDVDIKGKKIVIELPKGLKELYED